MGLGLGLELGLGLGLGLGVVFRRSDCSRAVDALPLKKFFQALYFISNEIHGRFFSNSWTTFLRRGRAYSIAANRRRPKRISIWPEVKIRRSDIFINAQSLS